MLPLYRTVDYCELTLNVCLCSVLNYFINYLFLRPIENPNSPPQLLPSFYALPHHITSQSTGVTASDEVSSTFQDFKLGKGEKLRYIIYKIEDQKTIVIEKKGERSKTFEDFCGDLPEAEPRYGLVDLEFKTTDGRDTSKLVMITWNPDNAKIKPKMLYSGSKEAIKTALNGVGIHINATDHAELDFDTSILPVCQKFG